MDVFATKLRERAAQLGISNAEVARRAGLSERRYGHYVSGVREPDLRTLLTIATTLGTTPDVLLGVVDAKPSSQRQDLQDRILSALAALSEDDLQTLAIQIEALAAARAQPT
ncbi:MAG: transcriptional regulator [Rhodobacteraceae bacterium GWE1_64_9]|nr:MAG: transcriptional regulator [Rhodobacteraceae bacterium GWE1_64_9]OHC47995.1 MAG: transcriptional regulator [Rhodobacteraceae bacterium GWF1_65_7]HBU15614.1 XRE family transcriptional regulator [Gemmobacter sp.]